MKAADADVLIAGGGLAAQRCCETLRRLGFDGRIVVLGEEPHAPYDRPPLSKGMLADADTLPELAFRPARWYAENDVELLLSAVASELDASARTVAVQGVRGAHRTDKLRYRELVIATGSRPRKLPTLAPGRIVHELRTHADALALRTALRACRQRLVVIGSGLVGMEVASSARARGLDVTLIEATATPLARALPPRLGRWIGELHREHGVDLRLSTTVENVALQGDEARLELSDGTTVVADAVLVAAGTVPATEWLAASQLGAGPILADAGGRTAIPGVYAAGDAACFPDPYLGVTIATQHWESAVRQGVAVARSIVGRDPVEPTPPMFWSDQHGHRIQLVGHAPPECEIEIEGDDANGDGLVAWASRAGQLTGAFLVNRPDALPHARTRIADAHRQANEARRAA